MEKNIDYKKLYQLQDDLLNIIFKLDHDFYLTGGTALHRYYYNYRYSDDLDFFAAEDVNFHEHINLILYELKDKNIAFTHTVKSRDFGRIIVKDFLQIDFVNDLVYRDGVSNIVNGYKIDNVKNILSNKIGALMGRDEEKDFFDLFCIAFHENFNWKDILQTANKKSPIDKDQLTFRIDTFPMKWLDKIKSIKPLNINRQNISDLIEDIQEERDNSLLLKLSQ